MKELFRANDITILALFHLTTNLLRTLFKRLFPSARGLSQVKALFISPYDKPAPHSFQ